MAWCTLDGFLGGNVDGGPQTAHGGVRILMQLVNHDHGVRRDRLISSFCRDLEFCVPTLHGMELFEIGPARSIGYYRLQHSYAAGSRATRELACILG